MYYNFPRKYKIPKICHQTWNTTDLCPEIKQIIQNNKLNNPDIEFKLHTDKDAYIKNNFDEITYSAFKKINPKYGAMLADFFRYCVLYNEGGIYLDIKSSLNTKLFDTIIKDNDICILDKQSFSKENWRYELGYGTYEQWLLIFCKGHLYLKNMINLMVEALNSGIEPTIFNLPFSSATPTKEKVLRITGPDAFAVAIHKSIIFNGIMHREISYDSIATLNRGNINKKIYDKYNLIHYSKLTEPIII
jgi:mannosyltransferase OCH1-like enzyme